MQTHHLQNAEGIESLTLSVQGQNVPKRPIQDATVSGDKISYFIILLSGGIAWGTMAAGFKGACAGVVLAIVLYFTTRKH